MPDMLRIVLIFAITAIGILIWANPKSLMSSPGFEPGTLRLEDMTWPEVHAAIEAGYRTAIIPTGGTEQNGPHAILGKHNYVVAHTSDRIARTLGHTLIAPVIAYVPEGEYGPNPTGHMKWPGTLTLPEPVFEQVLEATVHSLATHGFNEILLLGDSGGNQRAQANVAASLNHTFAEEGITIRHVSDYYGNNGQATYLLQNGFAEAEIGDHAGLRDTSELQFTHPAGIHTETTPVPPKYVAGIVADLIWQPAALAKS